MVVDNTRITRFVYISLILCFYFSRFTDSLEFVSAKGTSTKQVGDKTKNVVLDWQYKLKAGENITKISIGYLDENGNRVIFAVKVYANDKVLINQDASPQDKANFEVEIDNLSVARLTIKEVKSKVDDRTFFCEIINNNYDQVTSSVALKVYVKPVFTNKSPTFVAVAEGRPLTLQCEAQAEPVAVINWSFANNDKILPFDNTTGLLKIDSVKRNDSGIYTCSALNVGGVISYNVTVEVQYKPEINIRESTSGIGTYVGNPNPIYLKCVADGVPKPNFKWINPQKYDFQNSLPTFVLQSPESKDIGLYICQASNKVGIDRHQIEVIGIEKPGPVEVTSTTIDSRSARFDIKLPTDIGNGKLKEMTASYKPFNGILLKKLLNLQQKSFELNNLIPFTDYELNITVKNEFFDSDPKTLQFKTKEDKPGPPRNVTMVITSRTIEVSWLSPIHPNGEILEYFYIFRKASQTENITRVRLPPNTRSKLFENLEFYTRYTFKIRAATKIGTGDWSEEIERSTDPNPPTKPLNVTVTIDSNNLIAVKWKPPANTGGGVITKYHIKVNMTSKEDPPFTAKNERDNDPFIFAASQGRFYSIPLLPYVKVKLWVREGGGDKPIWGEFAGPISFEMPQGAPTKPRDVKLLGKTSNKVHLSWKRPFKINGVLVKFTVQFKKQGGSMKQQYVKKQLSNATFYHIINGLDANTLYEINIYAHSQAIERSDSSNMVTVKTSVAPIVDNYKSTENDDNTAPIIGGVVAFVCLMVIGIAVFLYLSRRKNLKHAMSNSSEAGFIKLSDTESKIGLNGLDRSNGNLYVSDFGSESGKNSQRLYKLIRPVQLTNLKDYITKQSSNNSKGFIDEFRGITTEGDFTFEVSTKPENKVKNRYANILAYDHSRVVLNTVENLDSSDYINANYIDGYDKTSKFIASQGPVTAAFSDFWRMVWEQNTRTIVMITNLIEKGRTKCQKYWPNEGESALEYGNIKVSTLDENELADYVIRRFNITLMKNGSEVSSRKVAHYQFISWPDHGCPQFPSQLLQFIKRIRALKQNAGPVVLHCSAGVGRTGTYMTIDAMLDQIEKEQVIDVFGYVTHVRSQRNLLVQTEPQYIFIYKTLLESISCGNTDINASNLPAEIKHLNTINPGTTQTYMQEEYMRLSTNMENIEEFDAALLPCNTVKNRFPEVVPYESTRVKLWPYPDVDGSDYINASFVDGYQQREAYILTQAPQQNTIQDFWRMLWEYEVFSIVMISSVDERDMHHCYPYWPVNNEPTMFGLLRVQISEEEEKNGYVKRQFRVTNTKSGESRVISHFMYFDWPVESLPDSAPVIEMIGQLQKTQQSTGNSSIVIHCSDGSGRSGSLAALMYCIERVKVEGLVDVFQTVRTMRTHRLALVQSLEQYQFIYTAVCNYLDCFSNYANFK